MSTLTEFFNLGMMREISAPTEFLRGKRGLNLGAGNKQIPGFRPLQLPEWDAEVERIPFSDATFDSIVAFHFLEHISPKRIPFLLGECQRVLVTGGTLNVLVPHRLGGMAFQDLDHKAFFTEQTWRVLFQNEYYKRPTDQLFSNMVINFNMIMGQDERCLALLTQFTKIKG